jgi:hypothetical protein
MHLQAVPLAGAVIASSLGDLFRASQSELGMLAGYPLKNGRPD